MAQSKNDWSWMDFVIPGLSSGLSFLGGLFGDSWEANAAHDQIQAQYDIANLNLQAQKDTNNVNALMSRERNEMAIQLQNEMNSFNKKMWDLNNQYNSPQMQLERARAAGVNPNVALGSPVAASPVQQTSIPQLETPRNEAPLMQFNPVKGYGHSRLIEGIGKALEGLSRLPFYHEELQSKRLENQRKKLENDALKNESDMYNNFVLYQNPNDADDLITQGEFDKLSDKEKDKYMYTESNGEKLPNLARFNIRSRGAFEAWKDMRNIRNFLDHVTEDNLQTKLRTAIAKEQLNATDKNGNPTVIWRLAHMPDVQYKNLLESYKKLAAENNWNSETKEINKKILDLSFKQLENATNHDFFTYIDKIGTGDMSTADYFKMFLVGLHDALSGASAFIRKR